MDLFLSLKSNLESVDDPRVLARSQHNLIDVLVITILAIICHAESWIEIENFGNAKERWLRKFLTLPNGIPSHDTFSRIFSLIEPAELEVAFMSWVELIRARYNFKTDTICIDGKTSRGTAKVGRGLNVVSAFSTELGIVLGQAKASGTGNAEHSAAMDLLKFINIEGLVIVGDAGIGRKSFCEEIVSKKADYIFPVKGNQKRELAILEELFKKDKTKELRLGELGHARGEIRSCRVLKKSKFSKKHPLLLEFKNIQTIGKIVYERVEKERGFLTQKKKSGMNVEYKKLTDEFRKTTQVRYFVSSLKLTASDLLEKSKLQWAIENQLHWVLDVSMGEDANRVRNKIAAQNLSTVRKIAINLVKQDKSKMSVRLKLKKAGWDESYFEKLLFGTQV